MKKLTKEQFVCKKCGFINNNPKIKIFPTKEDIKKIDKDIEFEDLLYKHLERKENKLFVDYMVLLGCSIRINNLSMRKYDEYRYYKCKKCNKEVRL